MKKEKLFTLTKKDFIIQTFRSGGKGGQHQNKTNSGVRIIHPASNAIGESRTERSQYQNKKLAFRKLVNSEKFKIWINKVYFEIMNGKTVEERVEEEMNQKNLKVEKKNNNKWVSWVDQIIES